MPEFVEESYFEFKEVLHHEGEPYFATPRSDENLWENPINFIFDTAERARDWLKEQIQEGNIEAEEAADWELVLTTTRKIA